MTDAERDAARMRAIYEACPARVAGEVIPWGMLAETAPLKQRLTKVITEAFATIRAEQADRIKALEKERAQLVSENANLANKLAKAEQAALENWSAYENLHEVAESRLAAARAEGREEIIALADKWSSQNTFRAFVLTMQKRFPASPATATGGGDER